MKRGSGNSSKRAGQNKRIRKGKHPKKIRETFRNGYENVIFTKNRLFNFKDNNFKFSLMIMYSHVRITQQARNFLAC